MELYYCDACGMRISPAELGGQTSASADGKFWCAKCKPAAVPPPAAGKSPVRGSQTMIPVRQASAPHHLPATPSRKSGASPAAPPNNTWALPAAGGVAAVLLGALVFGTSGGSTPRTTATPVTSEPERTETPRYTPPPTRASSAPSSSVATTPVAPPAHRAEPAHETVVARAATDPLEDAAQKAFDQLPRDSKSGAERIAALEAFIAKYDGAIVVARARTQLNELKAAQPQPAATVEIEKVIAPAPPGPVAGKTDTTIAVGPVPPAPAEGSEKPAGVLKSASNADTESRAAYYAFLDRLWTALARRDPAGAASILAQAKTDAGLKQKDAELGEERALLKLYDEFQQAVPKGLDHTNELDYFELQRGKSSVIKLGKRGEFKVAGIKDDVINLSANGVSMSVPLDSLSLQTWMKLAELDRKPGQTRGDQTLFFKLLTPVPETFDASKLRSQIAALDPKTTAPELTGAFSRRVASLEEAAAAAAYAKVEKLAEARDRKNLPPAIAAFRRLFGATDEAARNATALARYDSKTFGVIVPDGLIAYLPLDDDEGKVTRDGVGAASDGQITNCKWVPGKFAGALSFDGATSIVKFSGVAVQPKGITMSVWVKHRETTGRYERYITIDGEGAIIRREKQGKLEAVLRINGTLQVLGGDPIDNNRWQHVAFTWNGQDLRLFHNGVQVAAEAKPGDLTASTSGALGWPPDECIAGELDEARIYNRALSDAEIKQLAEQPAPKE